MKIQLSKPQLNYAVARAAFETARDDKRAYDQVMDAECERLGIETPFGLLPEGHPLWVHAQELLDVENAASSVMYAAAHELFDWATGETFKRCGTAEQKKSIMDAVAKVKKMAFVQKPFEELVSMSMRLAA